VIVIEGTQTLSAGAWPGSGPKAAQRGGAAAGLDAGHAPADHRKGRPRLMPRYRHYNP
jgi:hypothetical protein